MRGEKTFDADDRGQSGVLGVALITALVIVGTVGIVALGTGVLAEGRSDAQIESAEQAMTKLDATAALVALGRSDTQRASISLQGIDEQLSVNQDSGWIKVDIVNRSTGAHNRTIIPQTSLGSITYQNGDTSIAYQGGGVWKQVDGGSVMVSPPEFHYRGQTLTLPLITVASSNDNAVSGNLVLRSENSRNQVFPNSTADFSNPLPDEQQVNVTVKSDYYDAWGRFFEQRTEGVVSYDHPNETVTVQLIVPEDFPFDAPVISTQPDGITPKGNCNDACEDLYIHESYPLADEEIQSKIDDCEDGTVSCEDGTSLSTLEGGKTYYFDSSVTADWTINTGGGETTIVVDGDLTLKNVDVDGDGDVRIYLKGDLTVGQGGTINADDSTAPTQFVTYVHSTGEINWNGDATIHGVLYAPGSDADLNGGGEFKGSIVVETAKLNGVPSQSYDFPDSFTLGLQDPQAAYVNYLYISTVDLHVNGTG